MKCRVRRNANGTYRAQVQLRWYFIKFWWTVESYHYADTCAAEFQTPQQAEEAAKEWVDEFLRDKKNYEARGTVKDFDYGP